MREEKSPAQTIFKMEELGWFIKIKGWLFRALATGLGAYSTHAVASFPMNSKSILTKDNWKFIFYQQAARERILGFLAHISHSLHLIFTLMRRVAPGYPYCYLNIKCIILIENNNVNEEETQGLKGPKKGWQSS